MSFDFNQKVGNQELRARTFADERPRVTGLRGGCADSGVAAVSVDQLEEEAYRQSPTSTKGAQ